MHDLIFLSQSLTVAHSPHYLYNLSDFMSGAHLLTRNSHPLATNRKSCNQPQPSERPLEHCHMILIRVHQDAMRIVQVLHSIMVFKRHIWAGIADSWPHWRRILRETRNLAFRRTILEPHEWFRENLGQFYNPETEV